MNRAIKERNVCLYALPSAMTAQRGLAVQAERFESAQAFLFHYEEHKDYDVLLLDIEMPGMDGVSMARAIRSENEAVQIVFITGYSDYIAEGYDAAAGAHYDAQRVRECLKLAGFEERLQKMPKGLDTCLYKDLGRMAWRFRAARRRRLPLPARCIRMRPLSAWMSLPPRSIPSPRPRFTKNSTKSQAIRRRYTSATASPPASSRGV